MNRQRALAVTAAGAIATALTLAAGAAPASAEILDAKAEAARADLTGNVSQGVIDELQETFGLTEAEAYDRLAVEDVAADLLEEVPADLDESYAGLWVSEDADEIFVATTDASDTAGLRAEGATPVLVEHDLAALEDAAAAVAPISMEGYYGNYVDVVANTLVIETADAATAADLIEASGIDPSLVTVDAEAEAPQTYFVRGGDSYIVENSWRCSVGFSVRQGSTPGFVTAGHCGSAGDQVTSGEAAPGTFRNSVFPSSDRAWVAVGSGETLYDDVNMYSGTRDVANATQAAVGSSICRSGSTTGWHCGTVQAFNQTVRYAEGAVYGMTRTNVCAEPGDSGGSFISGNSAQGMTSGGSGNCSSGGTTYFQPIGPALSAWGLTLVTT
ncbi:S1 family peptidase [Glycomyces luteolus]|uniref:S1 family peptidase n=1 Tax=Glycomyces luteolus TaxID=2670330 RepID=A0A9X3PG35_9ACTN|nr:S1 family peptidase [Glycomyces luteolus]MDA1362820.1 S1 family peptidase [Glycomyces luteolus]